MFFAQWWVLDLTSEPLSAVRKPCSPGSIFATEGSAIYDVLHAGVKPSASLSDK